MKRRVRVLLSTISAAAMTAIFGSPVSAITPPADDDRLPIERLSSIRKAYLSALEDGQSLPSLQNGDDRVAQFRNFPNFPNFSNWRNQ